MSLGNINSIGDLFAKIKQLKAEGTSDEDIRKHLHKLELAELPDYFGRYESTSGRLWFEMYQNSDSTSDGAIVFRKGEKGKAKLEEDSILPRPEALKRFRQLIAHSYAPVFTAKTKAEMDKANEALIRGNEDILGIFYKDKAFIRIDAFGDDYSIQRGYGANMTSAEHERTESEAREAIEEALANGYHREGEKAIVNEPASSWMLADLDLNL